ncbi:glycine/betaine ABC transporter [Shewanella sp. GutCb]|uniref:glycine betaine ABC transporter substrate-binding protein n=1 Tax=Shewanella sp. GutCb TaxID=2058315 RepID=UPI000C7A4532|nr:glycine betaine ABC transporter substrate-binding protein [Shewanella sp. GutCb]PKG75449.1 glycine/betaine ABC transporter [Shewanella sp. GutCb]
MSKTITIGVTDLSFHRVTAAIIAHVLSDMGFDVTRRYASHQANFENLKAGDVDMLSSAWLPSSHGIYKADVEELEPLIELGLHYEPYAHWGVPDYVPTEAISQVSDLLKPHVLSRTIKHIQGINPGAGISRFSIEMMEKYHLNEAGYHFHTGSEEDCFGAFERAVANKEWLIVPLWKPQFLHHKFNIREIADPKGLLGTVDRAVLLLRQDQAYKFTSEQRVQLDNLCFSNEIIAELDYKVSREGQDIEVVTREWLMK